MASYEKKFNKQRYDKEYVKGHYERFEIQSNKDKELKYRLDILSKSTKRSRNDLIIEAIETMLEKEGL